MGPRLRWLACFLVGFGLASCVREVLEFNPYAGEQPPIGRLKTLATSQEQLKQQALVDQDGDGVGEYGVFQELAGTMPCRGSGVVADPPFLPRELGTSAAGWARGEAIRSGYSLLIYLPDYTGAPRAEKEISLRGTRADDANRQERSWVCYAWPTEAGVTGTRAFVVDEAGQVYWSDNAANRYDGTVRMPPGDAAFGLRDDMIGPIVAGEPTVTGDSWLPIGG